MPDKGKSYAKTQRAKQYNKDLPIAGYVYFITDGKYVKIGRTTNIDKRFQQLQTSHAQPLRLLSLVPFNDVMDMGIVECMLHRALKNAGYHVKGEWFDILQIIYGNKPRDKINAFAEYYIPSIPSAANIKCQTHLVDDYYSVDDLVDVFNASAGWIKKNILSDSYLLPHIHSINGCDFVEKKAFENWVNKQTNEQKEGN